jgi:hypothetical protein
MKQMLARDLGLIIGFATGTGTRSRSRSDPGPGPLAGLGDRDVAGSW